MPVLTHRQQVLEDRTIEFANSIIKLCRTMPKEVGSEIICKQLIRSATSVGANYAEASNASSKMDFRNKIYISKKEASESRYWLRLASKTYKIDTSDLIDEASQLIRIFQSAVSTIKNSTSETQ